MSSYLKTLKKRWQPRSHRDLFHWHCQKFFPFDRFLHLSEYEYLERCFQLSEDSDERISRYRPYSYFSYSHRVQGREVNSSRLSFGSFEHPGEVWQAAQFVLDYRGIQIPFEPTEQSGISFFGLGWDCIADRFKVYFRVQDWKEIPLSSVHDQWEGLSASCEPGGLLELRYTKNRRLEEKVYGFPRLDKASQTSLSSSGLLMLPAQHGMMKRYDSLELREWLPQLNPQGQRIVRMYQTYGEVIRCLYMKSVNDFVICLP